MQPLRAAFLIHVMLAYVIYSKNLGLVFQALNLLRDENIKFDVDLDAGNIYINEIEAHRLSDKILKSIVIPRKRYLRTVEIIPDIENSTIKYGNKGSGITTGSLKLVERINNTTIVEVCKGLTYYINRKSFWVTGEGFFSIKTFEEQLAKGRKFSDSCIKMISLLKKIITLD